MYKNDQSLSSLFESVHVGQSQCILSQSLDVSDGSILRLEGWLDGWEFGWFVGWEEGFSDGWEFGWLVGWEEGLLEC